MEYQEAVARLNQLRIQLGSGIKGAQYKTVLAEYMQLKQAIAQARGQASQQQSQGATPQEGGEWWQQRGEMSLL